MKSFECGTLVPGCGWHTQAESEAEIVRRAADHLREAHGEDILRPTLIEAIKLRVKDASERSPAH